MKLYPSVLTIAGSDCSGGAGIQADIKTISALGAYAASAITSITVQNTCGVTAIHPVPAEFVRAQIEAVMSDIRPHAVKIGMIGDVQVVDAIVDGFEQYRPKFVVLDPVMVSTSGCELSKNEVVVAMKNKLMRYATVLTPNLLEAEALVSHSVRTIEEMKIAAHELLDMGCEAVLVKGGHLKGNVMCDVLQPRDREEPYLFTASHVESCNTHGTGCSLSSAIATYLAQGTTVAVAVEKAKEFVHHGIVAAKDVHIGEGHGPINHFFQPVPLKAVEVK